MQHASPPPNLPPVFSGTSDPDQSLFVLEKSYSYTMRKAAGIRVSVMGGGLLLSFDSHNNM